VSENADKQSKIFDPSPRRIRKAREDGQVAKSNEVATAATVLISAIAITVSGEGIMKAFMDTTTTAFRRSVDAAVDFQAVWDMFSYSMITIGWSLAPFACLLFVALIAAHMGQVGILIAPKALAPKMDRLNAFKKIKEILGPTQALMRATVAFLKILFVGIVVAMVVLEDIDELRRAASKEPSALLISLGYSVIKLMFAAGIALSVVAVIDFIYQRTRYINNLKMTRDEVKQENKEEEGMPEVKSRRKSLYRELTLNKVLEAVPNADVVVTNPTHFAVALRYEQGSDVAPRVVAKGRDNLALQIRRIARKHGVPIVENRPLARGLWRKVKVGRMIPLDLYEAVAAVLAHIYRIKQRLEGTR
jgi:flagellar biosynthetic protein FlhB